MNRRRRWAAGLAGIVGVSTLAACLPTGLDETYGDDGVRASALSDTAHDRYYAVAPGHDGTVYAAGYTTLAGGDTAFALSKFRRDGSLDPNFGDGGTKVVNVSVGGGSVEQPRAIAIQPSGKIVVAGTAEQNPGAPGDEGRDNDFAAVRFTVQGQPDPTFDGDGIVKLDIHPGVDIGGTFFGDNGWGVGTLPGNRIVLYGQSRNPGAGRIDNDFTLVGLTNSGQIDTGFGTEGITRFDGGGITFDNARHVLVQPDGKIVTVGYAITTTTPGIRPVIARTNSRGQLDTTFGNRGVATGPILPVAAEGYDIRPQGDDYIIVGYGQSDAAQPVDAIAYRFRGNGTWDQTFGTAAGLTRIDAGAVDDRFRDVEVLPDGRILAVGSSRSTPEDVDALSVLLDADGIPVDHYGDGGVLRTDLGAQDAWWGITVADDDDQYAYLAGFAQAVAGSGQDDDAFIGRIALK